MLNSSVISGGNSLNSTIRVGGSGSDPIKVNMLFEKIEKSNNIEIEERSLKNLCQKFQHKLVDGAYVAINCSQQVSGLQSWLSRRYGSCSQQGLLNCIQIFKYIAQRQEGKILLRQIGCAELMNELMRQISDPSIQEEMYETMRELVNDQEVTSMTQSQHISSPIKLEQNSLYQPPSYQMTQSNLMSKHLKIQSVNSLINQIPEREEDPSFNGQNSNNMQIQQPLITSTINPFQTVHNKFQVTTITTTANVPTMSIMKPEHNYMETMHKQQQLKELCEIPYVMLCDEDEKILFDLSVQLKFGDFKNILNASQRLQNQTLFDYPIEVFLQRTDVLRALIDLMEGSNGSNVYTNLVQPCLLTFVQRLKSLYQFNCNNQNKVSHVTIGDRDSQAPQPPHIANCYPCNHNGKWSTLDEVKDANRYGYMMGSKAMNAASLQNSLSCKAALGLILTRAIYLLKDTEKIGLYVQLITETLDSLQQIYRVEGNVEFSEILHLSLFAFDSVCDFYKDAVFDELIIQSVLKLCIRVIRLLNTIPGNDKEKYKQPFSECLFLNTQNMQRTIRRALFKCFYIDEKDIEAKEILRFFERLEGELSSVNLLQKGVTQSFKRAELAYERFMAVSTYKLNAEGLLQNDDSSIIFIETLTQHYQSLDVLELLLDCIQLKLDFPFEHLLVDCIMYGVLATESSLDPHIEQLEKVFQTYLQIPIPEVRERILRKVYSKLRLQTSLSVNKKTVSNIALLAKFLYRKNILNQLINGLLINNDISLEESRLQMNIGTLIVKILIIAFNEGGQISQKPNLNTHILTFHSMIKRFPDCIGLLDLIEDNSQNKSLRFQRLLRDLFNYDASKREFATSVLRKNLSKESQELNIKDLVAETFDVKRNPTQETALELEAVNQNYDSSTLDIMNIQSILMSTNSDWMIKKSCLEQLTLILFDMQNKRGKQLFKSQVSSGARDLFNFLVYEILNAFNTCQGYLKQQSSLLELSHLTYLSECFKFICYSALLYSDESELKSFFSKFRLLTTTNTTPSTTSQQPITSSSDHELFLSACVFFSGSVVIRSNALKALFMTLFHPVILQTKHSKTQVVVSGAVKRQVQAYIAEFTCQAFVIIIPNVSQDIKMPNKEERMLSEEQRMYVQERLQDVDRRAREAIKVSEIASEFVVKATDKNENFNQVMRNLEIIQNYTLSLQTLRDEIVNQEVINSMIELMKTLPTRDFEFSFLADFFMIMSQILHSHKKYKEVSNLQLLVNKLCDAFRYHLLPFLIESGFQAIKDTEQLAEIQFSPRSHFVSRFLEILNSLLQADLYLQQSFRLGSGIQDRILINTQFFDYLLDLHSIFQFENRRKLQVVFNTVLTYFDTRALKHQRLTEILMSAVATHKMSQQMCNHSILMLSIRSLLLIHQRRFCSIKSQTSTAASSDPTENMSVKLNAATVSYIQKFQSYGWILRFIENRDSRIRVMAWDLITEIFDYDVLKTNPSIVQSALNAYLQHQELFSVKVSVLKFLLKVCDALMHNCDIFKEFEQNTSGENDVAEAIGIRELLTLVSKQGLISQMHVILTQKDTPVLFLTLSVKLLLKLVQMDHKKALPVLTQLDYWTFLVDLIQPHVLTNLETDENRLLLKSLKHSSLRFEDPCLNKDMILLSLNSTLEFIFEGFKRDAQLANMLVKTTKLLNHVFDTLKEIIDQYNSEDGLRLINRNLIIIYFDKVVKLLHVALMHPREYTVEALAKFLFEERRVTKQRNWIYITEMFRIINELSSSCSYLYGQIEVKLALSRFISEFLMRLPQDTQNIHLDEMVSNFDGQRYFDENEVFSREEFRTYGSLILLEMGMVFRGLYLDRDSKMAGKSIDELSDHENSKIDINICLCILLAKSKSAKTIAIEQNLAKKIIDICSENVSALHLSEIQKITQKGGNGAQKSTLGKNSGLSTNSALVQSVFESQIKRQYKYANFSDAEMCERETLRMLQLIRHLFFDSGDLLIPSLLSQPLPNQSKISVNQKKGIAPKKQESVGDKLISLWAQIMEELGNGNKNNEIINETLRGAITFAAQNNRYKGMFSTSQVPSSNAKKNSLLKIFNDKLLTENLQGNSIRMKFIFTLFRSISCSSEIAKEMMKLRTIEDQLERILPVCKNEKDIKLMKNYLAYFSSFIAGFSQSEDGQKILLKLKNLYDLSLFILDTITPNHQQPSPDTNVLCSLITHNLLFLRNSAFTRTAKLHFISNPNFLPCLLAFMSAQSLTNSTSTLQLKAYTAACLWVVLFNHQGVKAIMSREEILREMQILRQEYQRQADIDNYQYYIVKEQQDNQFNANYILPQQPEEQPQQNKNLRDFTLQALNGILQLLSAN